MTASVARISEISATSDESFDAAVRVGLHRAHQTLRNVTGAYIKDQRVTLDGKGNITGYVVHMQVTFVLESMD